LRLVAMNAQRSICWPAVVALGLLYGATARAEVIRDEALGFTLTVPEGFADYPPGRQLSGTLYAYATGEPGTDDFTMIGIKPMGGTIGREPLPASELPQAEGIKFDLRREKWKSFDIDVMVGVTTQGLGAAVVIAQVPLKRQAIQVAVTAPDARQADLLPLLRSLLASLDGPSNWLTDAERSRRAGTVIGGLAVVLGLAGWAFARWRKRRKDPAVTASGTTR
jgi:hypothetical protein